MVVGYLKINQTIKNDYNPVNEAEAILAEANEILVA